jgi:hypothetical protein
LTFGNCLTIPLATIGNARAGSALFVHFKLRFIMVRCEKGRPDTMKWLARILGILLLGAVALAAAAIIGGPDLIYPRVAGQSYGPSSIEFTDTDPGPTIGGTILLGRAQDEKGVESYMIHWGLEVGGPGTADDASHGDHGGNCKGFRDTNHVAMALPSAPGEKIALEIPQGTQVPAGAVYLVAHTLYGGLHNLAKCVQTPIVNNLGN